MVKLQVELLRTQDGHRWNEWLYSSQLPAMTNNVATSKDMDGPRWIVAKAPLVVIASARVAFAKLAPHNSSTISAAAAYVLAIGCFRFAVATW